jgi:hypothetical protein
MAIKINMFFSQENKMYLLYDVEKSQTKQHTSSHHSKQASTASRAWQEKEQQAEHGGTASQGDSKPAQLG